LASWSAVHSGMFPVLPVTSCEFPLGFDIELDSFFLAALGHSNSVGLDTVVVVDRDTVVGDESSLPQSQPLSILLAFYTPPCVS